MRRFTGDILAGYLPSQLFVQDRQLDLLDLSARTIQLPLKDVKTVSYVRDFNLQDSLNPERLTRRTFLARPRSEGLWVRLTFRSGDLIEGLAPTDLSLLDALTEDAGLFLIPPDTRSNTQRLYVPRAAIAELHLLAVITAPSRRKPLAAEGLSRNLPQDSVQEDLFVLPPDPD